MIEAVVFDLDGVIVDSEPVWERVRRQVVAEHGGQWAPDAQQRLMGMSTGEWARYLSRDLGAGLPPEVPSLGNAIAEGRRYFQIHPRLVFIPSIFLSLLILAVNALGDGLRDLLDPRTGRHR